MVLIWHGMVWLSRDVYQWIAVITIIPIFAYQRIVCMYCEYALMAETSCAVDCFLLCYHSRSVPSLSTGCVWRHTNELCVL